MSTKRIIKQAFLETRYKQSYARFLKIMQPTCFEFSRCKRLTDSYFGFILVCIFILSVSHTDIIAQSPIRQIGGRANGLSGASVCTQDVWAQYHNQAALAYLQAINVGIAFQNSFFVKELSTKSLSFALPLKSGVFGLNYYYFGYPKFNENKFGFSFAKRLGKRISLGGQIAYLYTHIDGEYGNKGIAIGEIGILSEPLDNLFIGAHVFNLWHSKYESYENEYLPTIIKLGASYILYDKASLSFELEKDIELKMLVKTGLEFEVVNDFFVRIGVVGKPLNYSFGLGYNYKSFQFNIAFSKHNILGYSPAISINYAFQNRI